MSINDFVDDHLPVFNMFFHSSQNKRFHRGMCIFFFFFFFCFVFAYNTEIQDGHQKWRENNFWEKWPLDSADTLQVKNFIKIALVRSISEINEFLCLRRNSRRPPKVVGKLFLGKLASRFFKYTVGQKFC